MRVISGTAKAMPLYSIEGLKTRPTLDRVKEALFSSIQFQIPESVVLDLFAGSGALGIEALSRGAGFCVFIEKNRKAVKIIEENLKFTKLEGRARVLSQDAAAALLFLEGEEPFDCIFMDPPYGKSLEEQMLKILSNVSYVDQNTLIIVEASLDTDFSYLEDYGFILAREKKYKTNMHVFIRKA